MNDQLDLIPKEPIFLKFFGKGSSFFGIVILNFILTILSLGLYYPWAKAKIRQYVWNETELKDSRFYFHGTGKEMFKGFLISYLILIIFYFLYFYGISSIAENPSFFFIILFVFIGFLLFGFYPFALFHAWKYRVTRTSWRGIYFNFTGNFKEFYLLYLKYIVITIFTFGIGTSWLRVNVQKYLFSRTKLGSVKLNFHGDGGDLFLINLGGMFLSYITIGLYIPFFIKNLFNFTVNNTTLSDGNIQRAIKSHLTGKKSFQTLIVNFLLLVVTLGLAFPFTQIRSYQLLFNNIEMPKDIDYDNISQDAQNYRQATGDEMADLLDIDIDF